MRKSLGELGAIVGPLLRAATLFSLIFAAFFLALPQSADAQIWVSSGFVVTPATPGVPGIAPIPGGQTETAYCSTSAINPATNQPSPAANDYVSFIAICTVTASTGAVITPTQCPIMNPDWIPQGSPASGNPTGICSVTFQPQPNVTYTLNSTHSLEFNPDPFGTQCGQYGYATCFSDPLGYYSMNPSASDPWPPAPTYAGTLSNSSTPAINTVNDTCSARGGVCAAQDIPSEYCPSTVIFFGTTVCTGTMIGMTEYWGLAQTSEPWQVRCSDVLQNSVTHYLVSPAEINATFIPNFGFTLAQAAQICNFVEFDWQQTITSWPRSSALTEAVTLAPLYAPPSFNDPPPNGYDTDQPGFADPLPVYYNPFTGASDNFALINYDQTGNTLYFDDGPTDDCLPGGKATACGGKNDPAGSILAFTTHLVGLQGALPGAAVIDTGQGFSWTSNFNGTHGGISIVSRSNGPVDPGSGTGGITITATSNTTNYESSTSAPPTLLDGTQISAIGSGLGYSRVSKMFVGTLTITNDSDSTITGPFQIVLDSLQSNVILTNATGSFGGWPYITVPNATSLDPGESATVPVRFSNPTDEILGFCPTVYSGSFD